MAEGTDLEKAKAFFSCGSEGKSEQDILYYLGVLLKNVEIGDVTIDADLDQIHTDLAAILAKLIAAPATEAKQDTGNTSLASILAKIIAAPATEAKQDTGNTSLASILLLSSPSSTITDHSGSIATGGTAQQIAAAGATRRWFFFENISDEDMWINFGTVAVEDQPSIKVIAGGSYENPPHFCPRGIISIISATTGKKFVSKEAT